MLHLSHPSKTSCPAFGFPIGRSCVYDHSTSPIGHVCRYCYAAGRCNQGASRENLEENLNAWLDRNSTSEFLISLLALIPDNTRYFRWFHSGDCPDMRFAQLMCDAAVKRPEIEFLAFTRRPLEWWSDRPKNLVIKVSHMLVHHRQRALSPNHTAYMISPETKNAAREFPHLFVCPGECEGCRVCWKKPGKSVGFIAHGHACAMAMFRKDQRESRNFRELKWTTGEGEA